MTITTKAALADELGVTRARVSQYVKAGLPVRSDGKLDRDLALNWLNRNVVGLNSQEDRGVNRAARLVRPTKASSPKARMSAERYTPPVEIESPVLTDFLRDAIVAMINRTEAVVAFAVVAAGGSAETAFAAAAIGRAEMMDAGSDVAFAFGLPDGFNGPLGQVAPTPYPPDWPALADMAGEAETLDQWREAEGRLLYWQDDVPAVPHPWGDADQREAS